MVGPLQGQLSAVPLAGTEDVTFDEEGSYAKYARGTGIRNSRL